MKGLVTAGSLPNLLAELCSVLAWSHSHCKTGFVAATTWASQQLHDTCVVRALPVAQGEAIAYNLREMFGLRVPVISVVIGEGGSGGALAIGCANKNLIMENSVYYVASPEACAAILWKSRAASSQVGPDQRWFIKSDHSRHRRNLKNSSALQQQLTPGTPEIPPGCLQRSG